MPAYSGFWETLGDRLAYSRLINRSPLKRRTSMLFRKRSLSRDQEVLKTDAVDTRSGAAALETYPRVEGQTSSPINATQDLGGLRTIETVTKINTTTSATTSAEVNDTLLLASRPSSYPVDASGNGGGGKGGGFGA